MDDVKVICGGVIPPQDYEFLYNLGVAAIFGPGTKLPEAVENTIKTLEKSKDLFN